MRKYKIDFHAVAGQGNHIAEGESSVAIVAMRDTDESYAVLSLFVTLTPGMNVVLGRSAAVPATADSSVRCSWH